MIELVLAAAASRVGMALAPNVEPVMAFVIMASLVGANPALVGFGAMALSDLVLGAGPWTLYTSTAYGLVGLVASFFKPKTRKQVALLSGSLTVLYDLITNIAFGFSMGLPLAETLVAGIPFSILHIFSNMVLCAMLLPQPVDAVGIVLSLVKKTAKTG
jgi:uncharacterized membrane protein